MDGEEYLFLSLLGLRCPYSHGTRILLLLLLLLMLLLVDFPHHDRQRASLFIMVHGIPHSRIGADV